MISADFLPVFFAFDLTDSEPKFAKLTKNVKKNAPLEFPKTGNLATWQNNCRGCVISVDFFPGFLRLT